MLEFKALTCTWRGQEKTGQSPQDNSQQLIHFRHQKLKNINFLFDVSY